MKTKSKAASAAMKQNKMEILKETACLNDSLEDATSIAKTATKLTKDLLTQSEANLPQEKLQQMKSNLSELTKLKDNINQLKSVTNGLKTNQDLAKNRSALLKQVDEIKKDVMKLKTKLHVMQLQANVLKKSQARNQFQETSLPGPAENSKESTSDGKISLEQLMADSLNIAATFNKVFGLNLDFAGMDQVLSSSPEISRAYFDTLNQISSAVGCSILHQACTAAINEGITVEALQSRNDAPGQQSHNSQPAGNREQGMAVQMAEGQQQFNRASMMAGNEAGSGSVGGAVGQARAGSAVQAGGSGQQLSGATEHAAGGNGGGQIEQGKAAGADGQAGSVMGGRAETSNQNLNLGYNFWGGVGVASLCPSGAFQHAGNSQKAAADQRPLNKDDENEKRGLVDHGSGVNRAEGMHSPAGIMKRINELSKM